MTRSDIRRTVLQFAREVMDLPDNTGDEELAVMLTQELGEYLDSIKLFSLVVAIEDHYKICLEPEDDESITSLDDVVNVVSRLLERQMD